jgi:hypothetical protein
MDYPELWDSNSKVSHHAFQLIVKKGVWKAAEMLIPSRKGAEVGASPDYALGSEAVGPSFKYENMILAEYEYFQKEYGRDIAEQLKGVIKKKK